MAEEQKAPASRTDPQALMDALDQRTDELAQQAYDRFLRVIPDARQWNEEQSRLFIEQAKGRFGAILAVMTQGTQVDQALRNDLEEVGASAAWAGTSLPHLLLVLRISRDLLLQTALRLADEQSGRLNASLGAFTARLLPSIDRLTDALSEGFWSAKLDQQQEEWHRLASVIEGSSYGVYEADLDGNLQYANQTFARMVGTDASQLLGRPINEVVLDASGAPVPALLNEPAHGTARLTFTMRQTGGDVAVDVDAVVRKIEDNTVGFGGIIAPAGNGSASSGSASRSVDVSVLDGDISELRNALATLAEAGAFIDRNAEKMTTERSHQAGTSIRRQSQRLIGLVDDLDEKRRAL